MPQMGFDMSEGTVARWLKEEGAHVEDGEPVAEIETDKAIVEFESYASGILHHIVVPEGVPVRVGETIAVVGEADEDVPKPTFDAQPPEPQAAAPLPPTIPPPVEPKHEGPAPRSDEVRASPVARRLAEELGVDLSTITGTGPLGRIIREDVLAAGPQAEAEESATPSSAATIVEPPVDESPVPAAIEPEVPVDESPAPAAIEPEVPVDESPVTGAIEPEVPADESPVTAAIEPEVPAARGHRAGSPGGRIACARGHRAGSPGGRIARDWGYRARTPGGRVSRAYSH
jgi:pyruvate dehydrogenase E2 component (dihydrolipoamide acetyltransferase)